MDEEEDDGEEEEGEQAGRYPSRVRVAVEHYNPAKVMQQPQSVHRGEGSIEQVAGRQPLSCLTQYAIVSATEREALCLRECPGCQAGSSDDERGGAAPSHRYPLREKARQPQATPPKEQEKKDAR